MKYILIFTIMFLAQSAQARVSEDAARIAQEIAYAEYNLSPNQLMQIDQHLRSIQMILNNGGGNDHGNQNYECVSRDNDGHNPWMLAYRDFTNTVRIPGTVASSKEECERNISNARKMRMGLLTCFTKDNDGHNPWVMSLLDRDQALRMERGTTTDYQSCMRTVNDARITREGILYCAAKDNDGRNPYVIAGYRMDGSGFSVGNETYTNYESCKAAL